MDSYEEFKMFYYSNIILFIVLLFVIAYIIINWDNVYNGNYWSGQIVKPILISGILFLIFHMILTWDDDQNISQSNELILPRYKLNQDINDVPNEIIAVNTQIPNQNVQSLNNKYRVLNKFDTTRNNLSNENINNPTLDQFSKIGKNLSYSDNNNNKFSNQNIFVSHRNSSKYGIKFN
jgi:hypothetical protein